jgi:hypothetical protein
MKVRIVKTIPMMLLLRFQRYSHSALLTFGGHIDSTAPIASGRIFAVLTANNS